MTRERPIGGAGRFILKKMADTGHLWHRTCGWRYESSGVTVMLLNRLAVDGYVIPLKRDGVRDAYGLTDKGKKLAAKLSAASLGDS